MANGSFALRPEQLVLGIETSCDETAAAVVQADGTVLSNVVASQDEFHAHFGGVVPEIAARRHCEVITAVVDEALSRAGAKPEAISLIAVTTGPGLLGSLVVGAAAAKAYAIAWELPLVAVDHVQAHMAAAFLRLPSGEPAAADLWPSVCLVVSGGHTDLVVMNSPGERETVGWTRDDAAGEALDKAARILGLGYPGGPAIDRASRSGRRDAFSFPIPDVPGFEFSFAGLKTALARTVEQLQAQGAQLPVEDLAASFQEAVVNILWEKAHACARAYSARQLIVAGGVAANSRLRELFAERASQAGLRLAIPDRQFCTDNAAMVALCGADIYRSSGPTSLDFDVYSALPGP